MNATTPYNIPAGHYLKNGKYKLKASSNFKWFDSPMRTIPVYKQGEYQNIDYTIFNPGSRSHIKLWMEHDHQYTFPYYTMNGSAKVDVDSLEGMVLPAGKLLRRYLKVSKDLSQLSLGKGAIVLNYNEELQGVTSRIDTNGTNTGRLTSSKINLNQIPAQKEFRELFDAPEGWSFVGTDFDGQENIVLAELLMPYDNGRLRDIIVSGDKVKGTDLHSINAKSCGVTRTESKPLWFGFLFGSSSTLTGYTLLGDRPYNDYTKKEFNATKQRLQRRVIDMDGVEFYPIKKDTLIPFTKHVVVQAIYGKHIQDRLVSSTTGLSELIADLKAKAKRDGSLTLLGGRVLPIRHLHAALNVATQGQGGEAMKYFVVTSHRLLKEAGLIHGVHYKQQACIYDEVDYIVQDYCVERFSKVITDTYGVISRQLNMQCTFTGEVMVGRNWWECH